MLVARLHDDNPTVIPLTRLPTLTKYTRRIYFLLHDLLYRDRKRNSIQWTEPIQVQYIATYDVAITLLNQTSYTAMATHPKRISPGTGK
jgi:hypothetical protein